MNIQVNNKPQTLAPGSNIDALIAMLELPTTGIAVAINNQIVPRTSWNEQLLSENDAVTIIRATQGG